jgi:hypothetical protein
MPVFKLRATIYVKGENVSDVSMELADILRHAVRNYPAFSNYHIDSCVPLDYEGDDDDIDPDGRC